MRGTGQAVMRLAAGVALSAGVGASAQRSARPSNRLTAAERAAGWRLLFDGSTLAGWRVLGTDSIATAHWRVERGTIHKVASRDVPKRADGVTPEGGDLMTRATFRDFELAWDWKIAPGGNSGVKYNVSEELSRRPGSTLSSLPEGHAALGFEYQLLDDERHADGQLASHRAGALYELVPPNDRKRLHAVGAWNTSRIVFKGTHGEHWLNGERIVVFDLGTPAMDSALARSKYRVIPAFGERRDGHIVLQDHGEEIWFRNVKLRELKGQA
ncbi:MAG: DUF1080 domain-containing protein [Gemmatimonadaceae bacterium]